MPLKCCKLLDDKTLETGCTIAPVWEAWYGATPDSYTHGCSEHIGLLIPDEAVYVALSRLTDVQVERGYV